MLLRSIFRVAHVLRAPAMISVLTNTERQRPRGRGNSSASSDGINSKVRSRRAIPLIAGLGEESRCNQAVSVSGIRGQRSATVNRIATSQNVLLHTISRKNPETNTAHRAAKYGSKS